MWGTNLRRTAEVPSQGHSRRPTPHTSGDGAHEDGNRQQTRGMPATTGRTVLPVQPPPRQLDAGVVAAALAMSAPIQTQATPPSAGTVLDRGLAGSFVSQAAAHASGSTTTIVLRVKTCRHCPVYVQQALDDGTYWTSKAHRVRAGRHPSRYVRGEPLACLSC